MSKHWVVFLAAWLTACTGETTPPEPVCGNGVVESDEACDDGDDDQTDICLTTCELASCGDGLVFDTIEQCDEGTANSDTGTCKTDCTDQRCGDGHVGPDEECDDENFVDTDACRNDCTLADCGDGVKGPDEDCDDENEAPNDGCSPACLVEVGWVCDGPCECAPGHTGTTCGDCALGWQDDDNDGVCEPGCDLFDATEGCPLGTECDVVGGTPTCVAGCPVFVDFGAAGDGSSWGSAAGNLQAAIDTAAGRAASRSDGCDVWVAEGTLVATLATDTITLRPDVDCYGGFAGIETSPDQRPRDEGGYLSVETVLDGGEIARHVVTGASDVTFDGFIVQGGNANGDRNGPDGRGGGLYAEDAEGLVLRDMWFRNNSARTGGALAAIGGWFSTHHSRFDENAAFWDGGAIAAIDTAATEIFDTAFVSNTNDNGWGGAIYSRGGGLLWLEAAYFFQNSAQWDGGAIWHAGNGEVVLDETTITDTNPDETQGCLGGAMYVRGFDDSDVQKGWASEAESLQSLTILGGEYDFNRVPYEGGALYLKDIVEVGIWGAGFDGNEALTRVGDVVQYNGGLGGAIVGYDLPDVTFGGGAYFQNNESGWNGGAVALFRTGRLVIEGASFQTNESHTGQGGGLFARDIADVRWNGATFSYNLASVDGGGAYLDEVGTVEVRDGNFYENVVEVSGMGAGLYVRGDFDESVATVVDTMFEKNNSGGSGSGLAAGYFASLDVRGTSFLENGNGPYTGAGSALYARFVRDFNLEHSFVDGNGYNRNYGPGGVYLVNLLSVYIGDTVIQNHPAPSEGSGSAWGGLMLCNDVSPFIGGRSCDDPQSSGDPSLEVSFDTVANIQDSTFSNNESGYGGSHVWALHINELTIAGSTLTGGDSYGGGAVWHEGGGDLTVTDCAFEGNEGRSSGSAINVQETSGSNPSVRDVGVAARLVVHSSTFDDHGPAPAIRVEEAASVAIIDSDFDNPGGTAANCSGSTPDYSAQGEYMGGAVHVSYSGPTTIEGCNFEGFQAQGGGAVAIEKVAEGPVIVRDTTFVGNHARTAGGTLYIDGQFNRDCAVDVVLDGVDVDGSSSCYAGGVLHAEYLDTIAVTDSSFESYGSAFDSGAAHIVHVDEVTIEDTSFVGSDVRNDVAGALLVEYGFSSGTIEKVTLDGVSVESSATSSTGGGVQIRLADEVEITGSRFEANSCDREFNPGTGWCLGAGVFVDNANEVVVERTAFFQNLSVSNGVDEGQIGGGLAANQVHSLTVRASVFWDNLVLHNDLSSTGVGGNRGAAIAFRPAPWSGRLDPTKLYVQGSTFVDNDATFATAITVDSDHSTVGDIDIVNSIIRGPGTVVGLHPSQAVPTGDIRYGNVQGLPNAPNNVIDVNPNFQPPNVADPYDQFRLSPTSAGMILTGTLLSADLVDFEGTQRKTPNPSMGAFEIDFVP